MTRELHERMKRLFLEACAIASAERDAFLQRKCEGDDELRRQIERLLQNHSEESSSPEVFVTAALDDAATLPPQPQTRARPSKPGGLNPGDVVGGRYRIVTQLGRGGMGEVYRADDQQLNQAVAIKFLTPDISTDPTWKARFLQEVRLAREVTHPNVCRVHDIGEADGVYFITMEYIDGEDLKTLLQRIGRLPGDKAIDIAHQLCAGLAAAHRTGVLHRDLKPANIMLDGRGKVRITDFGLAGHAGHIPAKERRAGTPRYMAPEQFAGSDITEQTDLYGLGLVLYELFTGKSAFDANRISEYRALHESETPSLPSSLISDMDPNVENAILACLRKDPGARPASALAVAAMLPGGDVLSAAIAAGETPSPEIVAAAGSRARLSRSKMIAVAAAFLVLFFTLIALSQRTHSVTRAGMEKAPEVLAEKARTLIGTLGYTDEPSDVAYRFSEAADPTLALRDDKVVFWYRHGRESLTPDGADQVLFRSAETTLDDPPAGPGSSTVVLEPDGRLMFFKRAPDVKGEADPPHSPVDWSLLIRSAGLDQSALRAAEPERVPGCFADTRIAWTGKHPALDDTPVRIEAAAHLGRPVMFGVFQAAVEVEKPRFEQADVRRWFVETLRNVILLGLIIASIPLARLNLRSGRSDRRGALRIAILVIGLRLVVWLLLAQHAMTLIAELKLAAYAALGALGEGFVVGLFYLALEPYVRRFWPQTIVAWSRVVTGRIRDSLVGTHIAIGALAGTFWALMVRIDAMAPAWLGLTPREQLRNYDEVSHLVSARSGIATCLDLFRHAVYQGLFLLLLVVMLRIILRKPQRAVIAAAVLIAPMYVPVGTHPVVSWPLIGGGCVGLSVWLFMRVGLVSVTTGLLVANLLLVFPLTFDFGTWYSDMGAFAMVISIGIVAFGIWTATSSRSGPPIPVRTANPR